MTNLVRREQSQYRRGLVLGFTVAETLLLLFFALLLALALLVAEMNKRLQAAELAHERAVVLEQELALAEARADVAEAVTGADIPEIFLNELVIAREMQKQTDKREALLAEREEALKNNENLSQALAETPDAAKQELRDLAALGQQAKNALMQSGSDATVAGLATSLRQAAALQEAMQELDPFNDPSRSPDERLKAAASEMATLKGQVAKLRNDLSGIGRGGEYPPCWVTVEGRVQYVFDVALTADGSLAVRDTTPPERQFDRTGLPVSPTLFEAPLSREMFLAETRPLFDFAQKRECRFFVRIKDETAPDQKALFKTLLLTVEAHFYKLLLQ